MVCQAKFAKFLNSQLFRHYVNVTTEIVVIPAKAGIQKTFENTGFPPARE
jgi:hypothetical protein